METDKDKQERPLSPILNNSHTFRRKTLTRKKSKTRINLSERFKSQENCSSGSDFKFKIPISPASKLNPQVVGFSTASGKTLHVPSDVINKRYEIYKHILQANYNDDTLVLFRKDFSVVNASKSDAEVSTVVDSNESNVRVLSENVSNLNSSGSEMRGFTVVECDNADDLMSRFHQFLNEKDDGEPPAKKIKLESENEYEILDDTLCNVFAKEDFSLMVSLSKDNNGSGARKQLEFISEDGATSAACDTPVQEDTLEKDIPLLPNEIGSNLPAETASEKALNRNKNCLVDELIVSVQKSRNSTDQLLRGVSGFRTASGETIEISAEALKKSEKLFGDDLNVVGEATMPADKLTDVGAKNDLNLPGFSTADEGAIHLPVEALKRSEKLFGEDFHAVTKKEGLDPLVSFEEKALGFTTAARRAIQISSQALKRSKKLFDDDFHAATKKDGEDPLVSFEEKGLGFTTAAGGTIQISSEALKRSEKLFGDDFHVVTKKEGRDSLLSFEEKTLEVTTAARRGIQMSSEALKRSEKLFGDDFHAVTKKEGGDSLVSFEEKGLGFTTAAGGTIQISSKALQRSEQLFGDDFHAVTKKEGLDPLVSFEEKGLGFATAAGRRIQISSEALKRSKKLFDDDFHAATKKDGRDPLVSFEEKGSGFTTAAGGTIQISSKALQRSEQLFCDDFHAVTKKGGLDPLVCFEEKGLGFATAAGRAIEISSEALKRSKKLFGNDFHAVTEKEGRDCLAPFEEHEEGELGFTTAAGGVIKISEKALKRSEAILADHLWCSPEKQLPLEMPGFSTASGGTIKISEEALRRSEHLLADALPSESKLEYLCPGFTTATGGMIKISEEARRKSERLFADDVGELSNTSTNSECGRDREELLALPSFSDVSKPASNSFINTPFESPTLSKLQSDTPTRVEGRNKRLGMSRCKQISISKQSMTRAASLFKDLDQPSTSNCIYSSTPLKNANALQPHQENKHSLLTELSITPVKCVSPTPLVVETTSSTVLQERTAGDTHLWMGNIRKQYDILQHQLNILKEREKALQEQQKFLESQNNSRRRQVLGVLSEKRASGKRLTLKEALAGRRPGDRIANNSITLQNAELVHFTLEAPEIPAVVYTQDGAVIIPNLHNLIGLSEVQVAFEAMIGVDRKLIPIGWIRNHYRLIVWKLSSFDRNFPDVFGDCLTVENVLQQLKYRYDREIDKAQRSALHRILEKDDVPQKRMVLCVSNIFTDGVEIELSDGWYCIRTVIDDPLKFQVKVSKIVIGTKLVVQSAEILNCDGCHPLEIPELVRLKINYNCTRRAVWYAKLGFQKDVRPFPVSLTTLHYDGGGVGCIRIHIFRVYPICYLEKYENGKSVWRNRKAEDRRVQEWENERLKDLELINRRVSDEFEEELKNADNYRKVNYTRLSDVKSTEMLCQMLEVCNDPEDLKESLSSSQLESVAQFQQEIVHQRHQEMSSRMSKAVNSLKHNKRQVTSVLKTKVVDRLKESTRTFMFNIWNPTEEHLQLLKERSSFYVYNITLKANGDLASTKKTYFTPDNSPFSEMETYQRPFRPISSLRRPSSRPLINEYDTVGLVVQVDKQPTHQEIWLTDRDLNLLHIKIYHGSDTCCLLDSVIRGQSVALLNVVYCEPRLAFSIGIANQCSIATSFPHQKFLQSNLEEHVEQLPKDLSIFLEDCDKKIHMAKIEQEKGMQSSISGSHLSSLIETTGFDDSFEDSTLIPSGLTSTDVAMSLIDTDQYFETV